MTFHVFETNCIVGNMAQKKAKLRCAMKEGGEWGDKDAMLAGLKQSDGAWERPEARFVETWGTWQRDTPEPTNGKEMWIVE